MNGLVVFITIQTPFISLALRPPIHGISIITSQWSGCQHQNVDLSRRGLLQNIAIGAAVSSLIPVTEAQGAEEMEDGFPVNKLPSGLKYLELKEGSGPSPQYGQLVSIQFTGYVELPKSSKKEKFDSNVFLLKHGNGRVIAGLDEGLHTMKVGGTRRLIIPPKLGYVQSGLGPLPEYPWDRWKLSNLLDDMVAQRGGSVIMDVTLRSVIDDEADQGYYQDDNLSPEEMDDLMKRLQQPKQAAVIDSATEMTI